MEYLKSVLRQEVGFFDTQVGSSTNFEVISAISGDAQLIQDVMADKVLILETYTLWVRSGGVILTKRILCRKLSFDIQLMCHASITKVVLMCYHPNTFGP